MEFLLSAEIKNAPKGTKMHTQKNKKTKNIGHDFPYITKHFAERYFERVLTEPVPNRLNKDVLNTIRKDMSSRMLDREKVTLELFANTSKAIVPIARYNQLVVKNNSLITVY